MNEDKKDLAKLRQDRNQDVLRKMKAGESLSSFDSMRSWYPERPPIEKDQEMVKRLFGNQPKPNSTLGRKSPASSKQTLDAEPSNEKKGFESAVKSYDPSHDNMAACPVVQLNQRRRASDDNKTS